ncbi:MAG: HEAT repeat domain-containing protein [Gammaproteobacteria bacterium]|nr:HEAT repeat domain-containing protein [Gammaproteobacteria bacterium]
MISFHLLWLVSLSLAIASVIIMLALILRRVILIRQQRYESEVRSKLTSLILRYLDGDFPLDALRKHTHGKRSVLMSELVADLLFSVRGGDRAGLIELLRQLDIIDIHLAALDDGTALERVAAIFGLSLFDDPQIIERIRDCLDDSDPDVRLWAAHALSEHRATGPARVLVDKLQIGSLENSRALRKIFRNLVPEHNDELIEMLGDDTPEAAKVLAIDALGRSGDYMAVNAISVMVVHRSEDVRVATLRALADLEHPNAQLAVMQALNDKCASVRATAATCAGRTGVTDAIPLLVKRLDDDSWWVRLRSAEALYELGKAIIPLSRSMPMTSRAARVAQLVLAEKEMSA